MKTTQTRPDFVRNLNDFVPEPSRYPGRPEVFGLRAAISRPMGLQRLGVHLDVLRPGERSSLPHAESTEEEGVLVLEGTPELWWDGELIALGAGDVIIFEPGTGGAHTLINQSPRDVRLLTFGERRDDNRVVYPLNPERMAELPEPVRWLDAPTREFGPHPPSARADADTCGPRASVRLRLPEPDDPPKLFAMLEGSSICETLIWNGPSSLDELRESLRVFGEETRNGAKHFFVIEFQGEPAGCADVRPFAWSADQGDVGLWVGERYQGRGVGTAAVAALVEHSRKLGLRRIEAEVFAGNWASRTIFERNGFRFEGLHRAKVAKGGRLIDTWSMARV